MKSFSLVPPIAPNHGGTFGVVAKLLVLTLSSLQGNVSVGTPLGNVRHFDSSIKQYKVEVKMECATLL